MDTSYHPNLSQDNYKSCFKETSHQQTSCWPVVCKWLQTNSTHSSDHKISWDTDFDWYQEMAQIKTQLKKHLKIVTVSHSLVVEVLFWILQSLYPIILKTELEFADNIAVVGFISGDAKSVYTDEVPKLCAWCSANNSTPTKARKWSLTTRRRGCSRSASVGTALGFRFI